MLFFACFFFAPVIDEETVFDSFGFCFKSYSSFEMLTTFLEGVLVDGPGVPFVFIVSVVCSADGVVDTTSAIEADVGSGDDATESDVGVDSFDAWSLFDTDFRGRFLGGDLSTDPAFCSLGGS
jgi:hypothetical protein